jgi:hypothetical protein
LIRLSAVALVVAVEILGPMKVRDSGMPEQSYWEGLFDIGGVLDALKIDQEVNDAVEVGCGYGTFTLPVAQRIRGSQSAPKKRATETTEHVRVGAQQ